MRKQIKNDQSGFTLVEVIVSCVIITIFISAATVILSSALKAHARLTSLTQAQTVADTVMETIIGEVSTAADAEVDPTYSRQAVLIKDNDDIDELHFINANGYHAVISVNAADKILMIKYTIGTDATDWYLGKETYMKNYICKLNFTKAGDNIVKAELSLQNEITQQTVDISRIIECYNLSDDKITEIKK